MSDSKTKKTKLSVYLPDGVLWEMRRVAVSRRIASDTLAVEEAVKAWIGPPIVRATPADIQELVRLLHEEAKVI